MTGGVRQIVRFNWPFYATAIAAIAVAPPVIQRTAGGAPVRGALYLGAALAAFWIVGSLVASWVVYDLSPLMRCHPHAGIVCGAPAHVG